MSRMPKMLTLSMLLLVTALPAAARDLTVSAAASLTDAFKEISAAYEKAHPDVHIKLNTAGSGTLLQQLLQGAPVDVLAVADQKTMDMAAEKGAIQPNTRHTFARNDLVLIVPHGSRLRVNNLQSLTQSAVHRIAISNPDSVPVGRYSKAALTKAGLFDQITPKVITTQNVRQSLDYVARGEVDTGFVYRTDAALMPEKVTVRATIPLETPVSYPIAITAKPENAADATSFSSFVRSRQGQAILQKYGFSRP